MIGNHLQDGFKKSPRGVGYMQGWLRLCNIRYDTYWYRTKMRYRGRRDTNTQKAVPTCIEFFTILLPNIGNVHPITMPFPFGKGTSYIVTQSQSTEKHLGLTNKQPPLCMHDAILHYYIACCYYHSSFESRVYLV